MFETFTTVFTQVLILFILILLGFILERKNVIDGQGVKNMTDLVLYLVTPCVIIKSFVREFNIDTFKTLLVSFVISVALHLIFIVISILLLKDKEKANEKVLQFGTVFSNCGYMSLPLQMALLGDDGVFIAATYVAIFNLFVWTWGIVRMNGRKALSFKKILTNPGIIGITIGIIIFVFSIPLPRVILEPIGYMASLNTPIPMIIIGCLLSRSRFLEAFKNHKAIISLVLKLAVFPLITLGVLYLCGVRGIMLVSMVISASAPVAAITAMFSEKFEANTCLSVALVSLSTLLSLITMPLIISLAEYVS